jgi:fatty-acyl-CoA synthase
VPDTVVGDQVMATILLHEGRSFDPDGFLSFLEGEEDLGTKWTPKYIRVTDELPETATSKVMKRVLRTEAWHCDEPVWWRPTKDSPYRRLEPADIEELDRLIAER